MENDTLHTVQEAAQLLGVGETAVRNAINENRLPFVHRYGRKLIEGAELEAYRLRSQPDGEKPRGRPKAATVKEATARRPMSDAARANMKAAQAARRQREQAQATPATAGTAATL